MILVDNFWPIVYQFSYEQVLAFLHCLGKQLFLKEFLKRITSGFEIKEDTF